MKFDLERAPIVGWVKHLLIRKHEAPTQAAPTGARLDDLCAKIHSSLHRLLNRHELSRRVFPHLGYLERQLRYVGMATLNELPVDVLFRALSQIEVLVYDWSDRPLAELRSRMAVCLMSRSRDPFTGANLDLSRFHSDSRLVVAELEASLSILDEMAASER